MAHIETIAFAQSVAVDRDRNTLSIFHLVDKFEMPNELIDPPRDEFQNVGPPFWIIVVVRRSSMTKPEVMTGRIRVLAPKHRKPLGGGEFKVDLTGVVRRSRAALNIPYFPFQGVGEYRIYVEVKVGEKWKKGYGREFLVEKLPA